MILMRQPDGWTRTSLRNFDSEAQMQEILAASPDLIPGCAGTATVRELSVPGAGYVDLICIDDMGTVTIVECKLADNPEMRRSVVGQIFAYASGLSGMTYDDFAARFTARANKPLVTAVQQATANLDEGTFRAGLEEALATGEFRLVLAVDEITDELKSIVEYLNHHLSDSVSLMALELGYLPVGGTEILVPATYGAEISDRNMPSSKQRSTESGVEEALKKLDSGPPRATVEALWDHARQFQAAFKGGVGASPSAGFYYPLDGKNPSVWSLYVKEAGPVVAVNLGSILNASEERAKRALSRLQTSSVLRDKLGEGPESLGKYPSWDLTELHKRDPAALDVIREAIFAAVAGDASTIPPQAESGSPT